LRELSKSEETSRAFQRKLYLKAKREKGFRFYLLYDKLYRQDILEYAWRRCRANKGAPGVDGIDFKDIEAQGIEAFLSGIANELKAGTYRPSPVRRVHIPKGDGTERPLSIPTIRDRVVQTACLIVLEPDFEDNSYGFRPKRNAHQAMAPRDSVWVARENPLVTMEFAG
jgi:RNA-directed DNA polymerase